MDVHKQDSQLCILSEDGELLEQRIRTEAGRFRELLGPPPQARILIESSTESERVARCLEGLGHDVIVADPNFLAAEAPFPVPAPMRLGVIPAGSADGLRWLNAGRVLVRGQAAPIIGSPSLEHTRIDLTAVPDARVGDEVVIIGRQGDLEITQARSRNGTGSGSTTSRPPSARG